MHIYKQNGQEWFMDNLGIINNVHGDNDNITKLIETE